MSAQRPVVPGRLHLLLAAQAPLAARTQHMSPGWLSAGEQARLATLQHPARRAEFLACRHALRQLLALGSNTSADHWRLDAPEGRAPHLNAQHHGEQAAASTHLSLSHSGAYLACAMDHNQPVGIDLEVKDLHASRRDVLALAGMACTPGELAQLQALDDGTARQRHFLQIWSLKEAYFKCTGTGVDFAAIRRIECQPAGLPSQGQVLAHARAWHGATAGGHGVLLSVCVLGAGGLPPCSPAVDADVAWQGEGDWRLVALPR
ncbi:4'-phosphopantetheinyl transferase superfamily protein [Acidovorax sp. Root217]|uniref:4'-phosphopantetheinyl transferase family protein n=1 Tax=Acidovorax sp. Root217 TaxID=1736492 RepID=UPI0007099BCE|nr:4'-phosphopantetheinyl transferase superfamily protein [Acidovorax sp. Root217]KRC20372.1 hypothetical protein ASE31_25685 [Acidovorax sp. Root217]